MKLNWDEPLVTVLLLFYVMIPALSPLAPVLIVAFGARRLDRRSSADRSGRDVDGAGIARSILGAAGVEGVAVVAASGPLANFHDPWRRELRLSPSVFVGRTPRDLGIAAFQAARALQASAHPRLFRLATLARLGLGLASGSAWIVTGAGILMHNPFLSYQGAWAELAAVVGLLLLLPLDRAARRRVRATWPGVDPIEGDPAVARAFEAASWGEISATLPLPGPRLRA